MWDLSSLTKDRTRVPGTGSTASNQGSPNLASILYKNSAPINLYPSPFYTVIHCVPIRFIIVVLFLCLLNHISKKEELQTKKYSNTGFYIYLCGQLPLPVIFISSYGFELLPSILSFQPEGLPLAFLLGWV